MNANSYSTPGDAGGNREELLTGLSILEPEETPFFSTIRKTSGAKSTFTETVADQLRKPRITGTREGAPAGGTGNKAVKRQRFGTYCHRVFDEWSVTDVQQDVTTNGGTVNIDDESAYAMSKCLREIKRDIEAICCSKQEMQGGSDAEMRTRGFFCWLASSLQTTNSVPTQFRPPTAALVSSVATLAEETHLVPVLKALKGVYGAAKTYDVIAGNDYIEDINNFSKWITPGSNNAAVRTVNIGAEAHTIELMVSVYNTTFGRCNIIPSDFVKGVDDGTGAIDGQADAAMIVNPELWEVHFLEEPFSKEEDDHGGGPSGWIRTKFALVSKNPRGNGFICNTL